MNGLLNKDGWGKVLEESGVTLFVKTFADSGFNAYRSETILNTSIDSIVAMAIDVEAFTEWVQDTTAAFIIEKESENRIIYYMAIDAPWPIKNRDWVNRITVKRQSDPKRVTITYTAVPDVLEDKADHIRVTSHLAIWVLEPHGDQQTRSIWMGYSNPGGSLPAWLVNMTIRSSILKSTENIRHQLIKPKYVSLPMPQQE